MFAEHVLNKRTIVTEIPGRTIEITHVLDETADLDYLLEVEYTDCTEDERAKYQAADADRIKAYERGDWCMVGVCVDIRQQTVSNWADGGLVIGRASIWGVESDSEPEHFAEVEQDCIDEANAEIARLTEALMVRPYAG